MEFNFKYKVGDRVIATDNLGRNKKRPGTIVELWLHSDHPSPYGVKFDDDKVELLWSEVHSLIPPHDVAPVVHGRWVKMATTGLVLRENVWNCSACGYPVGIWTIGSKYCPNCGARMRVDEEEKLESHSKEDGE